MTQTQYIDTGREYRETAEKLAGLVLAYRDHMIIPEYVTVEMVRLAEIINEPRRAIIDNIPGTTVDFTPGQFSDNGDGVHVKWEPDAKAP